MAMSAPGQGTLLAEAGALRAIRVRPASTRPAVEPVVKPGGKAAGRTIFAMFPVTCPVCQDAGREVTMGFLDHTLRFGDPIIRACSSSLPEAGLGNPVIGEPLTDSLDGVVHLCCPDPACGRRFGPYTSRDLRRRLLRSWR